MWQQIADLNWTSFEVSVTDSDMLAPTDQWEIEKNRFVLTGRKMASVTVTFKLNNSITQIPQLPPRSTHPKQALQTGTSQMHTVIRILCM